VRTRGGLIVLVLLAFVLRLYDLGGLEFWFDEAISANVAGLGWQGAIAYLRAEPFEHPPLYYLSLYPWQLLAGSSEFALRFYSVFWGLLFVPLLYALVRSLIDERLAWLAALMATISPFMVVYSQETRMYTLMPCLAVLALLSFHQAIERARPRWWIAYAVVIAVGVAVHYYFALVWLATTAYLLLARPCRRRMWLWGFGIQSLFFLVGAIWLIAAPGPRSSLMRVLEGETAFGLVYKLNKVMPALILGEIRSRDVPALAYVLSTAGWLLTLLGVWWSRKSPLLRPSAWRLLALLLVLPLVASFLIPYGVLARHLGYTLISAFTFMAFGLLALRRLGRLWLSLGVVVVLLLTSYGLVAQYTIGKGDFGQAMAYVDGRAQPGDLLILNQPAQRHLMDYYNAQDWPVHYLPPASTTLTSALVDEELKTLLAAYDRFWLGPLGAWTADPESLVEQWLVRRAFPAQKAWFPESTSVSLYFSPTDALELVPTGRLIWNGSIFLQRVYAGPFRVAVGDAVRLRFHWRSGFDLGQRYEVVLRLVDDQGRIWAERRSEPCGGWCPTDTWHMAQLHHDQHALWIPPGTPPGAYQLQVSWASLGQAASLSVEEDGRRAEQAVLADVTVLPAQQAASASPELPNPLRATFGGQITLLGYAPGAVDVQPGETVHLETYWRAEASPSEDMALLVKLTDAQHRIVANWLTSPSLSSYPTSLWQAGGCVRGQHTVRLPVTVEPGRYELRVALVRPTGTRLELTGERAHRVLDGLLTWRTALKGEELVLASVRVVDRPRTFQLPEVKDPLDVTVGRRAHLVGYALDASQARAGGRVDLTLYWQADGPMARPFKVFTHLLDADGKLWTQDDAPPGGGCCPANTWAKGEVIVDHHPIALPADLPPGTYWLAAGMYDEDTDTRLPAFSAAGEPYAKGRVPLTSVDVKAAVASSGQEDVAVEPVFEFDFKIYLPLIHQGRP
jgi:mannosyltransferase